MNAYIGEAVDKTRGVYDFAACPLQILNDRIQIGLPKVEVAVEHVRDVAEKLFDVNVLEKLGCLLAALQANQTAQENVYDDFGRLYVRTFGGQQLPNGHLLFCLVFLKRLKKKRKHFFKISTN